MGKLGRARDKLKENQSSRIVREKAEVDRGDKKEKKRQIVGSRDYKRKPQQKCKIVDYVVIGLLCARAATPIRKCRSV